jgi:hypothetical protein
MLNIRIAPAILLLALVGGLQAQQAQYTTPVTSVPRLVRISDTFHPANTVPAAAVENVTLSIYKEQEGGASLWQETQNVTLDSENRYSVLMGSTLNDGMPPELFSSGEPRWLGVRFNRAGETEQPRVQMTSVPYALKASDSDTLGGLPATAYLRAPAIAASSVGTALGAGVSLTSRGMLGGLSPETRPLKPLAVTANYIPEFTSGAGALGDSVLYQNSGQIGLGTLSPLDFLHVTFTNTTGQFIGYAVQNLGSTATSYSGMQIFDQTGKLGLFQGFNNSTHEYRINNVGPSGAINFLIGSSSKLYVANNGNIGIGTSTPGAVLDVNGKVRATTSNPSGLGVEGIVTATSGAAVGVYGLSSSPAGYGVQGHSNTNVGVFGSTGGGVLTYGVEGSSTGGTGVLGVGSIGVAGRAASGGYSGFFTGGPVEVVGNGNNLLAGDPGCGSGYAGVGFLVSGNMSGCTNYALLGGANGSTYINSGGTATIHFRSNNNELVTIDNSGNVDVIGQNGGGKLTVAGQTKISTANSGGALVVTNTASGTGVQGTAGEGRGGIFVNNSTTHPALQAQNNADNKTEAFWAGGGGTKFGVCIIDTSGNLLCSGSKSAVVPVDRGAHRVALYAVESPENWFEDMGSGQLSNGSARIDLDPTFAQTVNTGVEYHIFLTPKGDCKGLYVGNESAASFEVHELGGGASNIVFDYRIVAKRIGYEDIRLADFTERFKRLDEQRTELWRSSRAQAIEAAPTPKPRNTSMANPVEPAVPTRAIQAGKQHR